MKTKSKQVLILLAVFMVMASVIWYHFQTTDMYYKNVVLGQKPNIQVCIQADDPGPCAIGLLGEPDDAIYVMRGFNDFTDNKNYPAYLFVNAGVVEMIMLPILPQDYETARERAIMKFGKPSKVSGDDLLWIHGDAVISMNKSLDGKLNDAVGAIYITTKETVGKSIIQPRDGSGKIIFG